MRLALIVVLMSLPATAQTCTPNVQQRTAATLALQTRLLAAKSPEMDTDVPIAIRPLIHDFKQSLIETIDTGLRCSNPEPAHVQSGFAALLHANAKQAEGFDKTKGAYGGDLGIKVMPVDGQPGLLSIQISYGIECGGDNILLLYRHQANGWHRELDWQNPDLNSIGDALGDVFLFSPVPAPVPAVAIVHGTPWCSSNESMLRVDLVALATATTPQRLLDHLEHDYRRDADVRFDKRPNGFDLRIDADSVSGDLVSRPAILRYVTTNGHLIQQPVAPNAQAFVDSWLTSAWPVVSSWGLPGLEKLHDSMTATGADFVNFGPTLACGGNHYQVELDLTANTTTQPRTRPASTRRSAPTPRRSPCSTSPASPIPPARAPT